MLRVLSTKHGQLIADIQEENGRTVIVDGKSFQPLVTVQTVSRAKVLKVIRRLSSFMRLKEELNEFNPEIHSGFSMFLEKPYKGVKPSAEAVKQAVQANEPIIEAAAPPPTTILKKGKRDENSWGRRGRKAKAN